jgi:hypothetical protein
VSGDPVQCPCGAYGQHSCLNATMSTITGYGNWTAGWLCNEDGLAATFGSVTLTSDEIRYRIHALIDALTPEDIERIQNRFAEILKERG